MSSSLLTSTLALEYRDVSGLLQQDVPAMDLPSLAPGVPEHEVEQRVASARAAALAAGEQRLQSELLHVRSTSQQQAAKMLDDFHRERSAYFSGMEERVVQLALSIARRILQRESEMDPTLLAGLVRIALDRMQSGSAVSVRVTAAEAEEWRRLAGAPGEQARWQVVEDASLNPGDCRVQTEMGEANFGFEAQMCDVEQSVRSLLAHKPGA